MRIVQSVRIWIVVGCLVACLLLGVGFARAAYITFHGETAEESGTGLGNMLQTLVLQTTGSEWGSVPWDGLDNLPRGDATSQSQTQTVAALAAEGFDEENLLVILNISQTGANPALDVHDFAVRFYSSDGSSWFDALYDWDAPGNASSLGLVPQGPGLGLGTSGHAFRIHFVGNEGVDFFAQPDNYVGTWVDSQNAITNSNDGPEIFYMGDADVNTVVPEPVTLGVLAMGGLVVLAASVVGRRQ